MAHWHCYKNIFPKRTNDLSARRFPRNVSVISEINSFLGIFFNIFHLLKIVIIIGNQNIYLENLMKKKYLTFEATSLS